MDKDLKLHFELQARDESKDTNNEQVAEDNQILEKTNSCFAMIDEASSYNEKTGFSYTNQTGHLIMFSRCTIMTPTPSLLKPSQIENQKLSSKHGKKLMLDLPRTATALTPIF